MTFDLSQEEAWSSSTLLPVGNHVCTIRDPEGKDSSAGNPQIELRIVNETGDGMRDWITFTPGSLGRVRQFTDAADLDPSDLNAESLEELRDKVLAQVDGKRVGVIVRDEPHYDAVKAAEGQTTRKVQAYCPTSEIAGSQGDVPADTSGLAQMGSQVRDEDIPF